ncbi:MAG: hypothetical protein RL141_929 [Candidatus Parcubacteria bacterium]|jgi:nucleoside-diphosphate-sugar epimerase
MAHYLVTGGAGFIGSHLTRRLLADGHQVRIIDNLSTGKRERIPKGAVLVEADIRDRRAIQFAFEGIDGVFHCAALPRVPLSIAHPGITSEVNIQGTLQVLTAARDAKVKRVVYSASQSAYGAQTVLPLHPDMPCNPLNPYALQKYVGELYCRQFSMLYGLETVSLRYFNVYGPQMAEEGAYVTVISVFKRQVLAGEPITVHGDGLKTRDYTHVFDVIEANVRAMQSSRVGQGEVLNIGCGAQWTTQQVAEMFQRPITHVPVPPERRAEAVHARADITRTRELIGWEPKIPFEEGVKALLSEWGLGGT